MCVCSPGSCVVPRLLCPFGTTSSRTPFRTPGALISRRLSLAALPPLRRASACGATACTTPRTFTSGSGSSSTCSTRSAARSPSAALASGTMYVAQLTQEPPPSRAAACATPAPRRTKSQRASLLPPLAGDRHAHLPAGGRPRRGRPLPRDGLCCQRRRRRKRRRRRRAGIHPVKKLRPDSRHRRSETTHGHLLETGHDAPLS